MVMALFWSPLIGTMLCVGFVTCSLPVSSITSALDSLPIELAAVGINLLCGSLLPLLMFLIAERLWHDRCVSFGALALGIFYPPFVKWSYMIQRESLCLFMMASALLLTVWSWQKQNCIGFFGCGFAAALAVWTRYESVELIALLVGWALLMAIFDRESRPVLFRGVLFGVTGLVLGYLMTAWFVHQPLLSIFMKVRYRL